MNTDERRIGHMEVIRILRRYAADRFMKPDERAEGFYEAINEAERYFDLGDPTSQAMAERGKI